MTILKVSQILRRDGKKFPVVMKQLSNTGLFSTSAAVKAIGFDYDASSAIRWHQHPSSKISRAANIALISEEYVLLYKFYNMLSYGYFKPGLMTQGEKIGFIGLGNMGHHMAANLLKKGNSLLVYDIQSASVAKLEKLGAKAAKHPREVAEKADKIVTMLPTSMQVTRVYTGPNGILECNKPGMLLMDSSTIDPKSAKKMAEATEAKGSVFMDCPVSGGVVGAEAGTLTFMVGSKSEQEVEAVKPLLLGMGSRVVHCGPVGSGQIAKICNNMLLAITMIGTAETMNLAIRLGLDAKLFAGIVNTSTGRCWASEIYNPVPGVIDSVPASNGYKGGFSTALITKDLTLAQSVASSSKTSTPMGSLAYQLYQMLCSKGLQHKDFSVIYQFLNEDDD